MNLKKINTLLVIAIIIFGGVYLSQRRAAKNNTSSLYLPHVSYMPGSFDESEEIIRNANKLDNPQSVVYTAADRALVNELDGDIYEVTSTSTKLLYTAEVYEKGQAGLVGMVLDPDYANNKYVYLTASYKNGADIQAKYICLTDEEDTLVNEVLLLDGLPSAEMHTGGFLGLGDDNMMYIALGDMGNEINAEDPDNYTGKLLKINIDGTLPENGRPIVQKGLVDPVGMYWDNGRMVIVENR